MLIFEKNQKKVLSIKNKSASLLHQIRTKMKLTVCNMCCMMSKKSAENAIA